MNFLRRISTWKTFAILMIVYILFAVFVMARFAKTGEPNMGPLDLLFSYSPETAYEHLRSFGEQGRAAYAHMSLTADTAYPVIYTAVFMVLITLLARKVWPDRPARQRLALIPILAIAFDLLENFHIRAMIKAMPDEPASLAERASLFTSLKWSSVALTVTIILALLILIIVNALRKKP